ncbi:NAD(P)/FAD-dependent oxidoreductase [Aureispira anguillae]|uniref:Tryptophan 7-halogenase n=1 Tax=Aureispira anguillae TaxID=2864201 RepID=A0A915YM52_9BACT|nr:NAD(P)/FAD-dependent oxidoreductase [Aureispira anguillae]BDS15574.1 tryptophan 7-halogenase [Aureispira anguillae]
MRKENVDVLVIGAGPAGSVAAAILNQNGHKVKVVEKQQFPRFVIGESLLPRCLYNLEKAGLLEAVKAQNFQRKNGACFVRSAEEYCDFNFSEQYTSGWEYAWQMPRAKFDKTLADEIVRQGVELNYQEAVEAVQFDKKKALVDIKTQTGALYQVEAQFVVDASGYGRVLPRLLDLGSPSTFPSRNAFFAHIKDPVRKEGSEVLTEVVDLQEAWAWIIPIEEGITSIGFVGKAEFLAQKGAAYDENRFQELLYTHPLLKDRYAQNLTFVFSPKLIKGYSVGVKKMYGERYVLVGNSTEFLDPIFSSGVTFATETGVVAAELVHRQLQGETVDWEKDYAEYMQHGINVFRTYVQEWYTGNLQTIFFAGQKVSNFKEQICSVLAGYVWDMSNPYVKKHHKAIALLADVIKRQKEARIAAK